MPLYESKYASYMVMIRSEAINYHPATGVEIGRTKGLTAEFGIDGPEFSVVSPLSGETERLGQTYGHFFDSEEAKERLNWSDDEHDSVVAVLDKICREQPYLCARVEIEIPVPVKPWPTYDETHWKTIPVLAAQLGLTQVALDYERDNKNRDPVVSALETQLNPKPEMLEATGVDNAPEMITLGS